MGKLKSQCTAEEWEKEKKRKRDYYRNNLEVRKRDAERSSKRNWRKPLEYYTEKYGEEEGKKRFDKSTYLAEHRYTKEPNKLDRARCLANCYRTKDKKYGRENNITFDWIIKNVFNGQQCWYCGETDWRLLGVDRIDSNKGHIIGNCTPCCKCCNNHKFTRSLKSLLEEHYDFKSVKKMQNNLAD